jgi:hypothetical protein
MVVAATVLFLQFAAIQPSVSKPIVQPLGLRSLSHVHLLASVSNPEPGTAKSDGSSSASSKSAASSEGAESLTGIISAPAPATPLPPLKSSQKEVRKTNRWALLTIALHSAATYDAWSTRRAISAGRAYEADPLMRPFANSAALYGAIQAGPLVLDYFGHKMAHSQNNLLRRLWWLPQSVATAGFLFSGSHNIIHSR